MSQSNDPIKQDNLADQGIPYHSPKLRVHGALSSLTQQGNSAGGTAGGTFNTFATTGGPIMTGGPGDEVVFTGSGLSLP